MPDPGGMVPGPGCQRDPGIERDACTCETLRSSSGQGVVMGWLVVERGEGGGGSHLPLPQALTTRTGVFEHLHS